VIDHDQLNGEVLQSILLESSNYKLKLSTITISDIGPNLGDWLDNPINLEDRIDEVNLILEFPPDKHGSSYMQFRILPKWDISYIFNIYADIVDLRYSFDRAGI
jgi:hypothetical protein